MPPEPTTATETPEKEEAAPQPVFFDLQVKTAKRPWYSIFQKSRGKAKAGHTTGELQEKFRPDLDKQFAQIKSSNTATYVVNGVSHPVITDANYFDLIAADVGKENLRREFVKLINEIADDAAEESIVDGRVHAPTLAIKFIEGFLPGTRRSGTGKRQLQEKIAELGIKLRPYWEKTVAALKERNLPVEKRTIKFTPEEEATMTTLMVQMAEYNQAYEKKERKGVATVSAVK